MAIAPRSAAELLREIPAFKGLASTDLRELSDTGEVRRVLRSANLFSEGQLGEGLFIVQTGEIKVIKGGKDGREQILYLARAGRPIVEGMRFDGGAYPASAVAMRSSTAILLPNETLSAIGERAPSMLRAVVDLRAQRADKNLRLVGDLSLRTVPARLASFLCALAEARKSRGEEATHLMRDLTTETVAGRLGTVREEVSRGLAYLEREGALKVTPDVIEIVDPARLETIAYGSRKH